MVTNVEPNTLKLSVNKSAHQFEWRATFLTRISGYIAALNAHHIDCWMSSFWINGDAVGNDISKTISMSMPRKDYEISEGSNDSFCRTQI